MNLYTFSSDMFMSFLLALMRISLLLFFLPFFGGEFIPRTVKAFLCLLLTLALWPHLPLEAVPMPTHPLALFLLVLHELFLGLALSLCIHFVFAGLQTGGQLIGIQMGFSMLSFADPLTGTQVTVTAHLLYMVAVMLLLALDGHLYMLGALADSFVLLPVGAYNLSPQSLSAVLALSADMFVLAVRIAGPAIGALFLAELAVALMGRAAPQLNLLTFGFPIKIALGFFFLGLLINLLVGFMEDYTVALSALLRGIVRLGS